MGLWDAGSCIYCKPEPSMHAHVVQYLKTAFSAAHPAPSRYQAPLPGMLVASSAFSSVSCTARKRALCCAGMKIAPQAAPHFPGRRPCPGWSLRLQPSAGASGAAAKLSLSCSLSMNSSSTTRSQHMCRPSRQGHCWAQPYALELHRHPPFRSLQSSTAELTHSLTSDQAAQHRPQFWQAGRK